MPLRRLIALPFALALACSDSAAPGDDGIRPPSDLTILRLSDDCPPHFNPVESFYAVRGDNREVRIFLEDGNDPGRADDEYLRFAVDNDALLAYPDSSPFVEGDSVRITVRVVDPARLLFELEPAGLTFSPNRPAELKIHYDKADDDLDEDGDVAIEDAELELTLAIWRQESDADPFVRLGSLLIDDLEEIDAGTVQPLPAGLLRIETA